ncbi:beta strand repeat-containing protein [Roseateles sp. DC23W]|uniref:Beta strand repeat-containing protein n=1 Tax=Pelomonas dachongensis TaxID=3299029 RepID=A0ABW7EHW9_9BURK
MSTGNLTVNATAALNLGQGNVGGTLDANSGGAITQTGALTLAGTTTLNAGTAAITLTDAANQWGGDVRLTGGTAQLRASGPVVLGVSQLASLTATSTGALEQSGALVVAGALSLNTGSAALTLDHTGNQLGGIVNLSGGASQVVNGGSLTLGTLATGALTAQSSGALNLGQGAVNGNLVAHSANGAITQAGALDVTGASSVNAGSGAITLTHAGNRWGGAVSLAGATTQIHGSAALALGTLATGALTAQSGGALNLGQGAVNGHLVASSGGALAQTGALDVSGSTQLNAGSATITLAQAGNRWGGVVDLTGGATQLRGSGALTLGTLATGSLNFASTGALNLGQGTVSGDLIGDSGGHAITQAGALNVSGNTTLNAGTADIMLADTGNLLQGTLGLTAHAVTLVNQPSLNFANLSFDSLDATSSGGIVLGSGSLSGTLTARALGGNITQTAGGLTVAGDSTLQASGAITLTDAANQLQGLVNLASSGTAAITHAADLRLGTLGTGGLVARAGGALDLGAGSVAGTLSTTSGGVLTQIGALTVSGSSTFNAGSAAVTLDQAGNTFAGPVAVSAGDARLVATGGLALGALAVRDLTVSSSGALQLGSGSITGALTAKSGGALTQAAGGLALTGAAQLDAAGHAIQLTDAANAFAGAVGLRGSDVQLANATALRLSSVDVDALRLTTGSTVDLGAGVIRGDLAVRTQGPAITQTGALTVNGASSFVADGGTTRLTLVQAGNQLAGAVTVAGTNGGDFSSTQVVAASDLTFGGNAQVQDLSSAGLLTLAGGQGGALTAAAVTGIGQTGALQVGGLTTLIANGAGMSVDLSLAGNDFNRVQLTPGGGSFGSVQIRDSNGLQLGGDATRLQIGSAGALDLAGGSYAELQADAAALTQSGRLAVSGLTSLETGSGALTLARSDNALTRVAIASAGSASIANAGNLTVEASNVSTRLTLASPGTIELQGPLVGRGELVMAGSGRLNVATAQAHAGGTHIQAGRLVLQGPAATLGQGAVQLGAAGELDLRDGALLANALASQGGSVLNTSGTGTLAGAVTLQADTRFLPSAGAGGLTVSGAIGDGGVGRGLQLADTGTLTLTGTNRYGGLTDVAAGTLRASGAGSLSAGSAVRLAAGAVLALGADQAAGLLSGAGRIELGSFTLGVGGDGRDSRFDGSIAGSGGLTKLGAGRLTLAGSGAHTGATRVAAGELVLASSGALNDTTAVTVDGGATLTVQQAASLGSLAGAGTVDVQAAELSVGANGGSTRFDGRLTGPGGLAKLGGGELTLAGASTLAGDLQLQAGRLQLAAGALLPATTAVAVASGATLELGADQSLAALTGSGQVLLNPHTLTLGANGSGRDSRFDGVIGGTGGVTKAGTGTVTLGGANLYAGTTRVAAGTLNLAAAQALAGGSALVIDSAGRVQAGAHQAVASLAGSGALELDGARLAVGAGGSDSRFDGTVAGSGGLTQQGTGTLTLTGAGSNSGATVIEAGSIRLAGAGSLGSGEIQNQGRLVFDRADALTLGQAITGSGSLVVQQGALTLAGANGYTGATQVQGGSLITSAAERLPDASAVQVAAGAQLQLGGNETIASLQAAGAVRLAGDLTTRAEQVYSGSLTLANPAGITLAGTTIDASRSTNSFGGTPLGLNGGQALISATETLKLGNVTLSGGGRIEAERLALDGRVQVNGGSLALVASATPDDAKAAPDAIAQVPLAGVTLATAEATVLQGTGGAITVAENAQLAVQASGGGSVVLAQDANSFRGQLTVLSGSAPGTAWVPNVKGSLGVQSLVRVAGQQVMVGGAGIEADIVSIRADHLATAGIAKLVARLPFDETLLGKSLSTPSLTLELTPVALDQSGSFGVVGGAAINVEVGSVLTGSRSTGPNAGWVTVLPKGGAQGADVIVLAGPETGAGYRLFHDGARQAAEVPVVYNGVLPLAPSATGALSSINGDAEDARRARFQETVRTENVTVRLRSGVIAEVGPGRPSTQGSEGAAPPAQCDPAAQPALSCK